MYVVAVRIKVKPDRVEAFIEATRHNHEGSVQEPGCVRFDLLRDTEHSSEFMLYEVYHTPADFDAHKTTDHFAQWRDAVEPLLAEPRTRVFYQSVYPDPWR